MAWKDDRDLRTLQDQYYKLRDAMVASVPAIKSSLDTLVSYRDNPLTSAEQKVIINADINLYKTALTNLLAGYPPA